MVDAAQQPRPSSRRHPRRRRRLFLSILVVLAILAATCARLFVWPPTDAPTRADAILVLGGRGERTQVGLRLAGRGLAPVLAIAVDTDRVRECQGFTVPPTVELQCFHPDPSTTQGEARYLARLAGRRGWRSVIVVAGEQQVVRARLRIERCFHGRIAMVGVHPSLSGVPRNVAYESAALFKALTLQRSC